MACQHTQRLTGSLRQQHTVEEHAEECFATFSLTSCCCLARHETLKVAERPGAKLADFLSAYGNKSLTECQRVEEDLKQRLALPFACYCLLEACTCVRGWRVSIACTHFRCAVEPSPTLSSPVHLQQTNESTADVLRRALSRSLPRPHAPHRAF